MGFLENYEDGAEKVANAVPSVNGVSPFKIVSSKNGASMKAKIETLGKELKNSFTHIRNWIKLEMMNMETLVLAIHEKRPMLPTQTQIHESFTRITKAAIKT